ncbi:MAG TPA: M20/M25/M40 family metallo-hydrolase [Puia sp.]|nr:M20/M25/M40 family metallo-hydrolase [Puia sp.]
MRLLLSFVLLSLTGIRLSAQNIDTIINPSAVEEIEKKLASDDMRGRGSFTPDIDRAADYIESQFRAAGLKTWNGSNSYRQPFFMERATVISATGTVDGQPVPASSIVAVSSSQELTLDEHSRYERVFLKAGGNLGTEAQGYLRGKKNYLVIVDTSYGAGFSRLQGRARSHFKSDHSVVFVLAAANPAHFSIHIQQNVTAQAQLANVVGILPGKGKAKKEIVIFSGHYDHLGVRKPDARGDSIYNGANDDASGTTAVIMLARYFAKENNNKRTLVFAAFTAEEIGEFGSQYFSSQFDPAKVKAMFNIEMIGTESQWGTNSAYITGYERTDMGKILEKNLEGSGFSFHPDPYTKQNLFYRSDNASLARQGVPAHTISTSKMDTEKYYHTAEDEIGTLDMNNMARIIRSIAISSRTIVEGKDTPSRVDTTQLR